MDASDDMLRVLRGGSLVGRLRGLRGAFRAWGSPFNRGGLLGFRVVLLPSNSDL